MLWACGVLSFERFVGEVMAEPRQWWIRITSKEFTLPVLEVEGHLLEQFMGSEVVVVVPKTALEAATAERDANHGFLVITEKELEAAIKERDEARATLKASRPDVFTIITEQSYQLTAANAKVKELEWKLADRIKYTALPYNEVYDALTEERNQYSLLKERFDEIEAKSAGLVEALNEAKVKLLNWTPVDALYVIEKALAEYGGG